MPAALRAALNFLVTILAIAIGRVVWEAFGLIGLAVLLAALVAYGYLTRKPEQPLEPAPKKPNPWVNQ